MTDSVSELPLGVMRSVSKRQRTRGDSSRGMCYPGCVQGCLYVYAQRLVDVVQEEQEIQGAKTGEYEYSGMRGSVGDIAEEVITAPWIEILEEAQVKPPDASIAEDVLKSSGSSIAREPEETLPGVPQLKLDARPDFENIPVAISATLHPNTDAEPYSPSPDAEDFYTPLQAPTVASISQQDEIAKPTYCGLLAPTVRC